MRGPRHYRARLAEALVHDPEVLEDAGRHLKAVKQPPDGWGDLTVSHWRGQCWARKTRELRANSVQPTGKLSHSEPEGLKWNGYFHLRGG